MYDDVILIDLDCIVDVRLSILLDMANGVLDSIGFRMDDYITRSSDLVAEWADPNLIDQNEFDKRVIDRNILDLPSAPMTSTIMGVATMIEKATVQGSITKMKQDISVVVNTAPYDLSAAQLDVYLFAFEKYFAGAVHVSLVSTPLAWLTPAHLRDNYTQYLRYHGEDWLQAHGRALSTDRIPGFKLTIPFSYINAPDDESPSPDVEAKRVQYGMASAISMDIIPLESMSIDYELMGIERA